MFPYGILANKSLYFGYIKHRPNSLSLLHLIKNDYFT